MRASGGGARLAQPDFSAFPAYSARSSNIPNINVEA